MFLRLRGAALATAAVASATLMALSGASAQEVSLRTVTAFPKQLVFTKDFLEFIDAVNAGGKGNVQLAYMGGPEVTPAPEQGGGLRNGVFDVLWGPATYHLGIAPEGDALVGARKAPWEVRANGGWDDFNKIYNQKLNAHVLGWFSTGLKFHIYLKDKPKFTASGNLDLTGIKLRSVPIYREFFSQLGATNVSVQVPEVYSALERGLVDGYGWPLIAATDFGWEKFAKFYVSPAYFESDLITLVNLDKWRGLSQKARDYLQEQAIGWERRSHDQIEALSKEYSAKLAAAGVQEVKLEGKGAQEFLQASYEVPWKRLAERDANAAATLRKTFLGE